FGYDEEPVVSADLDYVTLQLDGRPVAGVHGVGNALPRDRGPHWLTYFTVADADDAADHVVHLGGQVLKPARDSAHGRVATVADPEGARFALLQPVDWPSGHLGPPRRRVARREVRGARRFTPRQAPRPLSRAVRRCGPAPGEARVEAVAGLHRQ